MTTCLAMYLVHGGNAHRPRRFEDASRIFEYLFDGGAHRVDVNHNEFVGQRLRHAESLFAHQIGSSPFGQKAEIVEPDTLARFYRTDHCVGIGHLDLDGLDLGARP